MIKLNEKAKSLIKSDTKLQVLGMRVLNVSHLDFFSMVNYDNSRLTEIDFLNTITEHTNLPISELIEGGKVSKLLAR